MNKNVWISIISLSAIILLFFTIWIVKNNSSENVLIENYTNIENTEISEKVEDDCINEWNDYKEIEETEEISSNLNDEETKYMIRSENGYICVYFFDDEDENLYKKTSISVEYLSEQDRDELEDGIEVEGVEKLNKLLEDFE